MASVSVLDFVAPYHYVYFIRALNTGLVKIGRTKNLGHRFAQLTSLVGPLKIIGCIPTFDPYLENQIHRLLKSHQVRLGDKAVGLTEWFQLSDEVAVIVIKEILRGIRSWSEEPTARVRNETSFVSVDSGELKLAPPPNMSAIRSRADRPKCDGCGEPTKRNFVTEWLVLEGKSPSGIRVEAKVSTTLNNQPGMGTICRKCLAEAMNSVIEKSREHAEMQKAKAGVA